MAYWLMKSEPETFSISDLRTRPKKTEHWDGVRNFQARNHMKSMKKGDEVFFYHSNCKPPGIVGVAEVVKEAYPDHTAQDPKSKYYDPRATPEKPYWYMVDIKFKCEFPDMISLETLRGLSAELDGFALLRRGNRLSVMPVAPKHWQKILRLTN